MDIETVKRLWQPVPYNTDAGVALWDSYADRFAAKDLPTEADSIALRLITQEKMLDTGGTVLDVGCGTGRFSFALESCGALVCGTDFSPKMVEKAEAERTARGSSVQFSVDNWHTLTLSEKGWEKRFDLVLANMTPAVASSESYLKLAEASRGWVLLVKPTRRSNSVLDTLTAMFGIEQDTKALDATLAYAFDLAWFSGGEPKLAYEEQNWEMETPLEKAIETYRLRLSSSHPLSADELFAMRAYLERISENGVVREHTHTTIAALYWHV